MVGGSGKGVQATKRQIVERAGIDAFQREITAKTRHRYLAVRSRSSHIARATVRRRAPDRLCFAHIDQKRTKLRANREGSAKHNFRNKEIPPILVWKEIFVSHG